MGDRDTRTNPTTAVSVLVADVDVPDLCRTTGVDPERPLFWLPAANVLTGTGAGHARGYRWASGNPTFSVMNTILPPNSPTCIEGSIGASANAMPRHSTGYLPPSSRHQGGCHILMGDGAVKFITDSIEAGSSTSPPVVLGGTITVQPSNVPGSKSPYGLWGALGTRGAKETIEEEL